LAEKEAPPKPPKVYDDGKPRKRVLHAPDMTPLTDAAAKGRPRWRLGRWGRAIAVMRFLRWKRGQLTAKICDPTRSKMSLRRNFGPDVDTPISALRWHIEDFDGAPVNPAAGTATGGGGGAGTARFRVGGTASREASKAVQRPAQAHGTPRGRKYADDGGNDWHAEGVDDDGGLPRHLGGRLLGGEAAASVEEDVHERLQREKTDALSILDRVLGRTSASTPTPPAAAAATTTTTSAARSATPAPPTAAAAPAAPSEEDKVRFVAIKQPLRQLFQAPEAAESSSGGFFLLSGGSAGDDDADSDDGADDDNFEPAAAAPAARAPTPPSPVPPAPTSFFSFGNLLTRCVAAAPTPGTHARSSKSNFGLLLWMPRAVPSSGPLFTRATTEYGQEPRCTCGTGSSR